MWGWQVALYLFFGGLSAGSFVFAAVLQLAHILPHAGQQTLALHYAPAQQNALGRYSHQRVYAHLRQIIGFQIEGRVIRGQIAGGYAPALFHGGPGGQPFSAVLMEGAKALRRGIVRARSQQHMSPFGMQHTVHQAIFAI